MSETTYNKKLTKILDGLIVAIGFIPYIGMTILTVILWRIVNLPAFVMPTNFFQSFTMFFTYSHNPYFWLMGFSLCGSWVLWWVLCKFFFLFWVKSTM